MTKSREILTMMENTVGDLGTIPDKSVVKKPVTGPAKKDNHTHDYQVNGTGSGKTSTVNGHNHRIIAYDVQPDGIDGHTHKLEVPEEFMTYEEFSEENPEIHEINMREEAELDKSIAALDLD